MNVFFPTWTRSLRFRIIFLTCGIAFFIAFAFGSLGYLRIKELTTKNAIEGLASETRLTALRFKAAYDEMKTDMVVVSKTPPIQGILRSMRHDDIDPQDNSTTELWRKRLAAIFVSIMETRVAYTQMRYIGIADQGRELVRVNRTESGFEAVLRDRLQQKGGEPYFLNSVRLRPGQIYISHVSYNRELGQVAPDRIPTVRTVLPIFDRNGNLFGMIVINADYPKLLTQVFKEIVPTKDTFVINSDGDYLEYRPGRGAQEFQFHKSYTAPTPLFIDRFLKSDTPETSFIEDKEVSYFVRLNVDPNNPEIFSGVAIRMPADQFMAEAFRIRRETLILAVLMIVASLILSALLASRFTTPLRRMTRTIRNTDYLKRAIELPTERTDEIGELARAFESATGKLLENKARLRAVIDNTFDGIMTINDHGIIEDYNPACERLFGYSAQEMTGRNVNQLIPEPYRNTHDGHLTRYRETGKSKIGGMVRELIGKRKDGSVFPFDLSVSEAKLSDRVLLCGVLRDITSRKQAEAEREKLIDELAKSNEELDDFAYIASHDLKEPLRAIHNHATFLQEDFGEALGADGEKRIKRLTYLSKRMEKLISDLLYFSRLGKKDLAFQETDLNEIIQDIEETMADQLQEANAVIKLPKPLPAIICNGVQITELFRNLIVNAVKYNDSPEKRIEIGVSHSGGEHVYVKDNGIGIDKNFHEDVFRIFKRLNTDKKYGEGTGSGLTFVKRIVEQHGGKIWIDSEPGKGSTFRFTLEAKNHVGQSELAADTRR